MSGTVGRPFGPVGPDRPFADFANGLRALKNADGSTLERLSGRANYSKSAFSDAAGGLRLPTLEVTLAFVRVCGGCEPEWETRWTLEYKRSNGRET
ncbi:hypothetical protein Rhe02_39210 [Rhizocola hellebori]|uniref:XRE family transcriptional regulator n=1 Tax=Rhizocola hellebori TaxID=1392758 RepID=A0A8J3Q9C8_9ACTN|nr:hypothetical protein Rhe02_39210 [Rhizocola hellebori]